MRGVFCEEDEFRQVNIDSDMTIESFIAQAVKDRYAVIVPENLELYARLHLWKIIEEYPCSGILIEQIRPGICYHQASIVWMESIEKNGLRESTDKDYTFGPGVIYCYPSLKSYVGLSKNNPLYSIIYKKCLRSILRWMLT